MDKRKADIGHKGIPIRVHESIMAAKGKNILGIPTAVRMISYLLRKIPPNL